MDDADPTPTARRSRRVRLFAPVVCGGVVLIGAITRSAAPGAGASSGLVAAAILAVAAGTASWSLARGRRSQNALQRRRLLTVERPAVFAAEPVAVTWRMTISAAATAVTLANAAIQEHAWCRVRCVAAVIGRRRCRSAVFAAVGNARGRYSANHARS